MAEQYFNLYSTTVGGGGYTSGSGILNVSATAGITLNAGDFCRLLVYRIIAGIITPIVLLKATAVNSSTQFNVTAESADANALATDVVINVLSTGGMDQIRKDIHRIGFTGALATDGRSGDILLPTDDCVASLHNGSVFSPGYPIFPLRGNPNLKSWSWLNQGSAVVTARSQSIALTGVADGSTSVRARVHTCPSTPYTLVAKVAILLNSSNFAHAGVCLTDGTAFSTFGIIVSGGVYILQGQHFTNATTFSANITTSPSSNTGGMVELCLCISDDGSNKKFGISPDDGLLIQQVCSETHTNFLTPSSIGFYVDANGSSKLSSIVVKNWYLAASALF